MKLAAILAAVPAIAVACSIERRADFTRLEMRPDFVVTITHRGNPLPGATVEIYRGDALTLLLTVTTTADGTARITGLRQGNYSLSAKYMERSVVWDQQFHVRARPTGNAQTRLDYTWGENAHPVRNASGVFFRRVTYVRESGDETKWEPEPSVDLRIEDVITHRSLATVSDADGAFDFGPVPEGTYLLHAQIQYEPTHLFGPLPQGTHLIRAETQRDPIDLLIKVGPEAERQSLKIRITGGGGCGEPLIE